MVATPTNPAYNPNTGTMPAYDGFAVSPSDSANLATVARAIYVGVAGNIKLKTLQGTSLEFIGLQAGSILPVQSILIFSTSTTATNLVALI